MKTINREDGYMKYTRTVILEDDYDRGLSDYELITYVDSGSKEHVRRVKEEGIHPCHFGGHVTREDDGKTATVTVYID